MTLYDFLYDLSKSMTKYDLVQTLPASAIPSIGISTANCLKNKKDLKCQYYSGSQRQSPPYEKVEYKNYF